MGHTPYGYQIENGKAVLDKLAAEKIKALFQAYLSGDSLTTAAQKAGIPISHAVIGNMLRNTHYLGDEYYPAIIGPETFTAAEAERIKRATKLGRIYKPKEAIAVVFPTAFRIKEGTKQFDDPFSRQNTPTA